MVLQNDNTAETHVEGDPANVTHLPGVDFSSDPWKELLTLQRGLDALVGHLFGAYDLHGTAREGQSEHTVCVEPDADIYESAEDYILHIALPGIEPEDIQANVTSHRVVVTAQAPASYDQPEEVAPKQAAAPQDNKLASTFVTAWQISPIRQPHLYVRRRLGRYSAANRFSFEHTFFEEIVPEQAQARLRHGRLDLYLPKRKPGIEKSVPVAIQVLDRG